MHGFKPKKAHAAAAQNFADGGMVGRIKGALGFKPEDPEREKRLADYRAGRELEKQQAKAAAAQPTPAAPQLQKVISSYAAGSALEERMRKAGAYAGGGMVRGKGTGTSDEVPAVVPEGTYIMPADSTRSLGAKGLASMGAPGVPVNLSNGEFKMPPEQVHAVGVQALDQMKGATHTPVQPQQAMAPGQPPEPELFFANGGVVTEEERQRRLAMQPAPYGLAPAGPGDASRLARVPAGIGGNQPNAAPPAAAPPVARPPAMVSPMAAMPVASKNPGLFPGNSPDAGANVYGGAGMALGTSGLLATGAERVIAAQPPRQSPPKQQTAPDPATSGLNAPWWSPDYARAANASDKSGAELETMRVAKATPKEAPADDVLKRVFHTGSFANKGAAPAPSVPPAAPGQKPAAPVPGQPPAAAAAVVQPPAAAAAPAAPAQTMPGVYNHGRGQYSDSAAGMGMPAGFTGQPSAQNMAAAQALSDRSERESMGRIMAQQRQAQMVPGGGPVEAGSFTGGYSGVIGGGSGNMRSRTPEQRRRDAETQASSMQFSTSRRGISALKALDAMELQGIQSDSAMEQARLREGGANNRAVMQDQSALARTQLQESGANQREGGRNALAQQQMSMAQQAQGFQNRLAAQSEQLRNTLLDPAATPEQRKIAQRSLSILSGKTAADRMQTVALPDTTTDTGQVVRGGQALVRTLEDGTVEQVPIGGQQQPALPPGMKRKVGTSNGRPVYEDMNGKQVIAKG